MSVEPGEVAWTVQRLGESVLVSIEDPEGTSDYVLELDDAAVVAAMFAEAIALDGPDALDDDLDDEVGP